MANRSAAPQKTNIQSRSEGFIGQKCFPSKAIALQQSTICNKGLQQGQAGFTQSDMALHASVCKLRRGTLVGGEAGAADLVDQRANRQACPHRRDARPGFLILLFKQSRAPNRRS
jgi:hypothetical protein